MMEQENLQPQKTSVPEEEIDLLELAGRLWQRRKFIIKAGIIGAVIGLVVAFSIPKEYAVTVMLTPESSRAQSSRSLANAAALLGMSSVASGTDVDALNILLFPDILKSNPFALELYSMPVTTKEDETMPLNEYMTTRSKPWWSWVIGLPRMAIGGIMSIFKDKNEETSDSELNPFRLTREETARLHAIKSSMSADVDKKTGVTTITVTMQDPVVAATVADSVITKLQSYIIAYRTKKAINDREYFESLYKECQEKYYSAQQNYATYVDGNKSLYTNRSKVEGERLQNDMNQAYQIYNQVASQLQMAHAKVQEAKPVFAVVNPATVPIKASAPRKMIILIGVIFLACAGAVAWILFGENIWEELKKSAGESEDNAGAVAAEQK